MIQKKEKGCFRDQFKLAEVTPLFQKKDELSKESINVLSQASKIFGRIILKQINLFLKRNFSPLLTRIHKNHSTQNALLDIIEKWKHALIKAKRVGTIIVDVSEEIHFDHNLLFAKLNAYGFSFNATKFLQGYLLEQLQSVNINNNFSE